MALPQVSKEAIDQALSECREVGRDKFLDSHGFARATRYEIDVDGERFDPKAIFGVARGIEDPSSGTLKSSEFTSGEELRTRFQELGFDLAYKVPPSERPIGELFNEFLHGYDPDTMGPYNGDHPMAQLWKTVRNWLAASGPVKGDRELKVKQSVGAGNWAGVPWIAFLDPRETTTTQSGVYVVILVKQDRSGFYLTAAHGVTRLKKDHGARFMEEKLSEAAQRVRASDVSSVKSLGFNVSSPPSVGSAQLAKDYEKGVMAHKFYPVDSRIDEQEFLESLDAVLNLVDRDISSRQKDGALQEAANDPVAPPKPVTLAEVSTAFGQAVAGSGLLMPPERPSRPTCLLTALVTKPFVILAGMSGSGKTQIALRLGEWLGRDNDEQPRFLAVAVRPDWTGPEALFGYEDALRPHRDGKAAWFVPPALEFLLRAKEEPEMPYLLLLDEMNLAHVERYFSDYLSGIESGAPVMPNLKRDENGDWRPVSNDESLVPSPKNVFVIGTVNVDETTYQFSPKVIDRSTTFEVRTATEELSMEIRKPTSIGAAQSVFLRQLVSMVRDERWQQQSSSRAWFGESLIGLHRLLSESGHEFGHRVFFEALRWAAALEMAGEASGADILDLVVLHKLLPRIHGSRRTVEPVLEKLHAFAVGGEDDFGQPPNGGVTLPRSVAKIERMMESARTQQFVSYLE